MKFNKEYLKSKSLWMGLIVLLLPFYPEAQTVVTSNFETFNSLLGIVLAAVGVRDSNVVKNLKGV